MKKAFDQFKSLQKLHALYDKNAYLLSLMNSAGLNVGIGLEDYNRNRKELMLKDGRKERNDNTGVEYGKTKIMYNKYNKFLSSYFCNVYKKVRVYSIFYTKQSIEDNYYLCADC